MLLHRLGTKQNSRPSRGWLLRLGAGCMVIVRGCCSENPSAVQWQPNTSDNFRFLFLETAMSAFNAARGKV